MTRDYPLNKPVILPKQGSWPDSVHLFDEKSADALLAAEAAGRPLLVRGEPGVGKSQLARAAAVASGRLLLSVAVNARTESQDLQWEFDAVGRLSEAQFLAHTESKARLQRMNPHRFLSPGPLWWAFNWASAIKQWQSCHHKLSAQPEIPSDWTPEKGTVLLIDQIDKADSDLPNALLETLGNSDFAVPYLGVSVCRQSGTPQTLVVITTNEDRELPPAFLRRCLVLPLLMPKGEEDLVKKFCRLGEIHFGERCSPAIREQAARLTFQDRREALNQNLPPPGQAEYLDLLRAVCNMAMDEAGQREKLTRISRYVLQKNPPIFI